MGPALKKRFRVLTTGAGAPGANMAMDEALFSAFEPGVSPPVMRFYSWDRVCYSAGVFQDAKAVETAIASLCVPLPVVRRPTGGGILAHGEEITYSLVCSAEDIAAGMTVRDSFREACGFLMRFYRKLGLSPAFAGDEAGCAHGRAPAYVLCADSRERYDIIIAGRKIGGNAQKRRAGVMLQHGSIPLRAIGLRRACLADLLGAVPADDILLGMVMRAAQESFGVSFMPSALTQRERGLYYSLREGKYAGDDGGRGADDAQTAVAR